MLVAALGFGFLQHIFFYRNSLDSETKYYELKYLMDRTSKVLCLLAFVALPLNANIIIDERGKF